MKRIFDMQERARKERNRKRLRAEYAGLYRALLRKNDKFKRMEDIRKVLYGGEK